MVNSALPWFWLSCDSVVGPVDYRERRLHNRFIKVKSIKKYTVEPQDKELLYSEQPTGSEVFCYQLLYIIARNL